MRILYSVLALAGLSPAAAQYLVSELSFGYSSRISPDTTQSIPNFSIQGNPSLPEVLSNRVILTPPAPGNQRAGIWADRELRHTQWVADVDFRANGPERGAGNLNIWLVRDGAHDVGSSSIYTVGKFEGLALVIDTYGGSGGMVRGFLNDGTSDYNSAAVDGLSFGHCSHPYRNLGRPSQIKFRQTPQTFKVEVDGKLCFASDQISIPPGYKFGVTAASADNPDSFEVFKMVVMTDNLDPNQDVQQPMQQREPQREQAPPAQQQKQQQQQQQQQQERPYARFSRSGQVVDPKDLVDEDPNKITSSTAQFADLHNRLQSVNHQMANIFHAVASQDAVGEKRHEELSVQLGELKGLLSKLDRIGDLENKINSLESEVRRLKGDVTNRVRSSEQAIKGLVSDTHATLHEAVKSATPGHGRLYAVFFGSNAILLGGYIYYKRRKATSPKKYL